MERTKERSSFRKKFIGDRKFYMMVLAVAVPIMIQNGITNFVSLLDNIMIGRIGTEQMSGASIVNQLIKGWHSAPPYKKFICSDTALRMPVQTPFHTAFLKS